MSSNYNSKLDTIGKLGPGAIEDLLFQYLQTLPRYKEALADLFEQLLMFDKIAIEVSGDNFCLAILINELGLNTVTECIEEGVIELVLVRPLIVTEQGEGQRDKGLVDKNAPPIANGTLNDARFVDPFESVKDSFKWVREYYSKGIITRFAYNTASKIKVVEGELGQKAVDFAIDSYTSNKLAALGLAYEKEPVHLNYRERTTLQAIASQILSTTILIENEYSSFDDYVTFHLTNEAVKAIKASYGIKGSVSTIIEIEKVPDFRQLFLEHKFNLKKAVELRRARNAEYFRKWVSKPENVNDVEYVSKYYIDEIANAKGPLEKPLGKAFKMVTFMALGAGLGGLLAGIPGTFGGVGVGSLLEKASDVVLDSIDTYLLGNVLKGKTPRLFIDKIREQVNRDN